MTFAFWLSLAAFIAVAFSSLEVALGWRRIRHLKDVAVPSGALQPRVSPPRRSSIRWAQALSMALPRRPLTCWERFCRVSVMAWLASEIRWK